MNATIDIIGLNGLLKHSAVFEEGSVRKFELMKEDYVRLIFSTNIHFAIGLGDHITLEDWGTFEITEPQQPKYNSDTGGYDYDLQFNAPYYKWNNKLFKFEPATNRNEASWSLTDTLRNHMAVFLRNLVFYGWNYTLDIPASLETAAKHIFIQYDNSYMLDALTKIAEAFECEWWVTDNIIHFGKCESGTAIDFELGVNVEDMGAKDTKKDYITRLYAFGSNRNIPANYRKSDEQVLLNGVVQKRLMLPSETPFVDIEGVSQTEEIVEGIVIFDDVFPQTNNAITDVREDVRTVEKTETTVEAAGNTDTITETSDEEAETENVTIYRFKDSRLVFSESNLLPGVQLQVQFQSGRLNGMIFDLAFNPDAEAETIDNDGTEEANPNAQWFEIIRNETYGLMLPNETLRPATGDSFVLIGWDITKMESGLNLITQAEEALLERTEAYAEKLQIDPNTYPCKMMSDYMYGLDGNGQQDSNYSKVGTFPIGQRVRLNNATFFKSGSRLSRVVGYEYKLDKPYDEAIIYVGESATYSAKERTASAVDQVNSGSSINYRGNEYSQIGGGGSDIYIITSNDNTDPADSNVFSALRTEKQYVRKDRNDSVSALWTFNHGHGKRRGVQTKHYNENGANEDNLFGKGFELVEKVNSNGDIRTRLEVDELFVRIKAFFAQLEIREISYVGGNYVFSAAGSKIYYVEWIDANNRLLPKAVGNIDSIYKFRCYLYSDNGTTATENRWAVNDQAMCQIFNIDEDVHQGATNKYYWRRVLGTGKGVIQSVDDDTEYQYVDISKADCSTNSDYPEAEDTIVQFGNWTNSARQGVIYLMAEGESAPAIIEYSGVGANGRHFVLPDPTLLLSPTKNVIYGEFHSVVDGQGGNTGSGDTIEDQLRALLDQLNDIKNQADKKFDIWFGSGIPLPSKNNQSAQANYPASEWTTEALKALHAQDLFYDTTREPAADGGRAWRWIAAAGDNNTVTYYWDEVTDADTLAALEQISDVASDGVLTGGAEKTRVLVDWNKAEYEYWKYTEQARDYGLNDATYWDENEDNAYIGYIQSFLALGKYLNGGADLTLNNNGTYNTPSWLAGNNLWASTEIANPNQYRTVWNNYYSALASLLKAITKRAKELADQAQADATEALNAIEKIASDGWLMPDEKIEIRRDFVAAYHEMNDDGGLLDKAMDDRGNYNYISYNRHVKPYVDAFNALGTYLNGGTSWTSPATDPNDSTAWILPLWIDDSHMNTGVAINGDTFCSLWATFYSTRTMVLAKLSENAQQTATGAHERVDDIVSDGVISAGSEKSLLYIDWLKTVAEYSKYIEQAADYFGATNTQDDGLVMAYKKLATMLNNCNPATQYANVSDNILNGTTRPLWLDADHINADTVLSETPIQTADAYRTIWNNYHVAITALLEVITSKAKELADAAQADATEALSRINDMGNDGKLVPDEKLTVKREFLAAWHERDDEGGILDRCKDNNQNYINSTIEAAYVTPYLNAFKAVGSYLNGRVNNEPVTWTGITITSSTTDTQIENAMPAWLKEAAMGTTNNIDGDDWRNVWAIFYSARTALLTALSKDAKDRADDALDKIGDIVDDGIISGGSEKALLYLQWMKAAYEYVRYVEQAHDYGVSTTAYVTAYTNLVKMLNGGTNPTDNMLKGITSPLWLNTTAGNANNINHDTALSDFSLTADQYRTTWNNYNSALVALLEAIDIKSKELADQAQADATEALNAIESISLDGVLSVTEIPDLRREFETAYRQRQQMVDLATSDSTHKLIDVVLRTPLDNYLVSFKSLANYMNEGNTWTEPSTYTVNNGQSVTSANATYNVGVKIPLVAADFPSLLGVEEDVEFVDDWKAASPTSDGGATFRNLWADLATKQVALANAMATLAKNNADEAQETADDAQDKIADIVNDGIISKGSEKTQLYKEWSRTMAEYFDYYARARAYGFHTFGTENVNSTKYKYYQDYLAFDQAFDALVLMLNGGTYGGGQEEVNKDYTNRTVLLINGNQLEWLADLTEDTIIGDYTYTSNGSQIPYTADKYRTLWNAYYYASVALLDDFTAYSKELADEALNKLSDIASDGKITPSEKSTLLVNWREVVTEYPLIVAQANAYTNYLSSGQLKTNLQNAASAYITAFNTLATILNGGTAYAYTFSPANFPTPSWLGTGFNNTETLDATAKTAFNNAWDGYYNTRTALMDIFVDVAKKPGDDALGELGNLAADNILTPFEKLTVLRNWDAVNGEYTNILSQASKARITGTSAYTNYVRAYYTLGNYLYDLYTTSPTYSDRHIPYDTMNNSVLVADGNTTINGAYFKEIWSDYYARRTDILAAISNSKVGYFISVAVPTPPYYKGDFWMKLADANDTIGTMMVCINTRESGSGQLSDWAEVRETARDPRILLAALAEKVYGYVGGYIKEKARNAYLALYFTTSTNSAHAEGDLRFDGTTAYQYSDMWEEISNDTLTTAFRAVWDLFGNGKTIKIYNQKPSGASEHDLICSSITFTDPYLESGNQYKTVEGGIEILMYGKNGWEVLRESTRSIIENLRGYIRMVAFGSASGTLQSSGIVTQQNFAQIFSQAVGDSGDIITAANIGTYIDDFVDENGVRQIISGATISADQIDITGNDRISLMVKNAVKYNVGANLITSSLICETSAAYGFAKRYVKLEQGQKYTFSANGLVPYNAYQNGMELRVYVWRMNNGSWANTQQLKITYNSGNAMTKSVTFTADATADYFIQSYMALASGTDSSDSAGGTRTYGVTVNWYKLEKGETATEWIAGVGDEMLWKNYITNPRAVDGAFDTYIENDETKSHCSKTTDATFGEVVRITHDTSANWQLRFTAGNGYTSLAGKVVTFFCICKNNNDQDTTAQLRFGGGDENVSALNTQVSDFIDLGNGWKKYYATRYIKTGLMSDNNGQNTNAIGINCVIGTWFVYAVGVVLGGVCPTTQEIMEHCGLKATGIDIENNRITLYGNNIVFGNSDGSITGKIWIDPTAGTLHATNANINGLFTSENVSMGNSITIDAESGYMKMRGPTSVIDGTYLPNGSTRGDMLDIHFETDADTLCRFATFKLSYANGRKHIGLDPDYGLSMYDYFDNNTVSLGYQDLKILHDFVYGDFRPGCQYSSSFAYDNGFFVIMDSNLTLPNLNANNVGKQYMLIFNSSSRTINKASNATLIADGGTAQNSISPAKNSIGLLISYVDNYGNYVWDFNYVS